METQDFDKFADEYHQVHSRNIVISGETPEFFAEYKIKDIAMQLRAEKRKSS